MPKVIDSKKYYSHRNTGRPRNSEYIKDPVKIFTYGMLREQCKKEAREEARQPKDFWNWKHETYFWSPEKTNNALIFTSVIWLFVLIFASLSFATK